MFFLTTNQNDCQVFAHAIRYSDWSVIFVNNTKIIGTMYLRIWKYIFKSGNLHIFEKTKSSISDKPLSGHFPNFMSTIDTLNRVGYTGNLTIYVVLLVISSLFAIYIKSNVKML